MAINAPTPPELPVPEENASGSSLRRIVLIGAGGLIGAILLVFIIGMVLAATDNETVATVVGIVRDIVIILLALEGILIILALAILILQVARLISLLQAEVKPVLENAQDTMKTAQGTIEFVSNNMAEPIIKAGGFLAGIGLVLRELFGIRRAIRRQPRSADLETTEASGD
jgi:hypothetical protein